MRRYTCVADQKAAGFPVTKVCEVVEVSTSGFYDWCVRSTAPPTVRELAETELVELMREIFDASDGNYGVPRMHRELRRCEMVVNVKRVRRFMRLHGMAGRFRRRRCQTTFPGLDGYVIPDLIGRADAHPGHLSRQIDILKAKLQTLALTKAPAPFKAPINRSFVNPPKRRFPNQATMDPSRRF